MSAEILADLRDDGILPTLRLADLLNINRSSAARYYADTDLRYGQLRTLVRQSRDPRIIIRFLADLLPGTGIYAAQVPDDLDINRDGAVDTRDVLASVIQQLTGVTARMRLIETSVTDGRISDHEHDEMQRAMTQAHQQLVICETLIGALHERESRRKCRPLVAPAPAPGPGSSHIADRTSQIAHSSGGAA